jgi:DNA-binding MarR family transcriptional regulator
MDSLAQRFDQAFFTVMQHVGPELVRHAKLGLTPGQVFMLYFISQETPCTVSKLADKMEVNPSAITVMLDRLKNHGLIDRQRHQNDRRVVVVTLTTSGHRTLEQMLSVRSRVIQHCLTELGAETAHTFVETLEDFARVTTAMDLSQVLGVNSNDSTLSPNRDK